MKALVVGNGQVPSRELIHKEASQNDLIIGADGGAQILIDAGIRPHVVIGDLDSFSTPDNFSFELIHDHDQETNDLEKALSLAIKKGITSCTVLGALGLRVDHTLKNLSVLQAFDNKFDELLFRDDDQTVLVLPKSFQALLPIGTSISLFPISGKTENVTTHGLKYPLYTEVVENGVRDATSNETIEEEIKITYTSGCLIAFFSNPKS